MRFLLYTACFCVTFMSCVNKDREKVNQSTGGIVRDTTELPNPLVKKPQHGQEIVKLIAHLADTFGFLRLPYTYDYNQDSVGGIQYGYKKFTPNYDRLRQLVGCDMIIGILPDTTNYFGLVVGLAASVMNVDLITIDKQGERIARESLIENNCLHYVEEDIYCRENVILTNSLSINYSYETLYIMEGINGNDTICEVRNKFGRLLSNGVIKFEDSKVSNCK